MPVSVGLYHTVYGVSGWVTLSAGVAIPLSNLKSCLDRRGSSVLMHRPQAVRTLEFSNYKILSISPAQQGSRCMTNRGTPYLLQFRELPCSPAATSLAPIPHEAASPATHSCTQGRAGAHSVWRHRVYTTYGPTRCGASSSTPAYSLWR